MFTGIVQCMAHISSVRDHSAIRTIQIRFPEGFIDGLAVGGSVSVDGVCLTTTMIRSSTEVSFDVILQSLAVTTLSNLGAGATVNVERAARDGAEIGGHPLSGHVDFSTVIHALSEAGANKVLRIHIPEQFRKYIFAKGYIAVNGASLTVSECNKHEGWFDVWLIPETRRVTNLDLKLAGDLVNIEIDRGTHVLVDSVRGAITEALGNLRPALESFLAERGLGLEELVARPLALTGARRAITSTEMNVPKNDVSSSSLDRSE
jgi:riboflavin synthase